MPGPTDFVTPGKVINAKEDFVVFAPRTTNYELQLKTSAPYTGPTNAPIEAIIRAAARKIWTVPSGGNFVEPIVGRPRIIQGRVRFADDRFVVIQAGANFIVELPSADSAIDLNNGPIALNTMVNAVVFAGTTFELATQALEMVNRR